MSQKNFIVSSFQNSSDTQGSFVSGGRTPLAPDKRFSFHDSLTPSAAAEIVCRSCLESLHLHAQDLSWLISATLSPDFSNPGLVSSLLHRLEVSGTPGLEIRHLSAGPIFSIDLAASLLEQEEARFVLVSCTDFLSRYFPKDLNQELPSKEIELARDSFSDGSAAFLIFQEGQMEIPGSTPAYRLLGTELFTYPGEEEAIFCPLPSARNFPLRISLEDVQSGCHFPQIHAEKFLETLSQDFAASYQRFLKKLQKKASDISKVVSHQFFEGMNKRLCELMNISESLVFDCYSERGQIGAAGIPYSLSKMPSSELKSGELIVLVAFQGSRSFAFSLMEVI